MFGTVLCMATMVLGIDVGWQPDAEGDLQYLIQLEPEIAQRMFEGKAIEVNVRPEHQGTVRHFRFQVGRDVLPREELPAPLLVVKKTAAKDSNQLMGSAFGRTPHDVTTAKVPDPVELKFEAGSKESTPPPEKPFVKPSAKDLFAGPSHEPGLDLTGSPSDVPVGTKPIIVHWDPNVRKIGDATPSTSEPVKAKAAETVTEPGSPNANSLKTPLIFASCMAGAFLAAFGYLFWIHLGTRKRYDELLHEYYSAVGNLPGCGATEGDELVLGT